MPTDQWQRSIEGAQKSIAAKLTSQLCDVVAGRMAAELISVCRVVGVGRSGRQRAPLTKRRIQAHVTTLRKASKVLTAHGAPRLADELLLQAERINEPPRRRGSPADDAVRWFVHLTAIVFKQHQLKITQTCNGLADQVFATLFEVMRYDIHKYRSRRPWLQEAQSIQSSADDVSLEFDLSDNDPRAV